MKKLLQKINNLKLNIKFTLLITACTMFPIGVFAVFFFWYMEQNVVQENISNTHYTMERNRDAFASRIDSINMTTQFFLTDDILISILDKTAHGKPVSTQEWLSFKNDDVSHLERLVTNNPVLYGVRVYAVNDNVQEMMPILYNNSRMHKLSWAEKDNYNGWNFDYTDAIFESYALQQNQRVISLVTTVTSRGGDPIGTVEAAMTMNSMFPSLYEKIDDEWSCFATQDGEIHFGDNEQPDSRELAEQILTDTDWENGMDTRHVCLDQRELVISRMQVKELGGELLYVRDITDSVSKVRQSRNAFLIGMVGVLAVLAVLINLIVREMLKKFYEILFAIREVQKGDLDVVIEDCGKDEMGELGNQINTMLVNIKELMADNLKREMLNKNSEIRALQNQINAHFIYNVLESIKMMAEIEEKYEISDAVTALGKLLRYSMRWVTGNVLVEQELDYIKNYMALINLRFDYEIYLSVNIPELILKQEIPKMTLQPIVENAIYHGIEQLAEDTNIYIKGIVDGEDCIIEISDSGKGMTEEELEKLAKKIAGEIDSDGGSGNGIGLKNVQDRIHIAFGDDYGIQISSKLGVYTKVMVRIPILHEDVPGVTTTEKRG